MPSFEKLKTMLLAGGRFLVIGHIQPDGDAIGSMLAFGEIMKGMGKEVDLVIKDPVPDVFYFLPGWESIKNDFLVGSYDCIVLLDNGDLKRTGFAERIKQARSKHIPIINIDHHIKNDIWKIATINYADESAPATAFILYDIAMALGVSLSPAVATCLLAGIYNDTGGFHHSNTTDRVLAIVSDLLSHGGKLKQISDHMSNDRSMSRLRLWGVALNSLVFNREYAIVTAILTQEDIKQANASEDDVTGLANLLNSANEAETALLLYEAEDGKIRGSLRTENNKIDVAELATYLGGGGHKKAAGFNFEGRLAKGEKGNWRIF